MTFKPSAHLNFYVATDCSQCCPRIFYCFYPPTENLEIMIKDPNTIVEVERLSINSRVESIKRLYLEAIPGQIGKGVWEVIERRVYELSGVCLEEEMKEATPITKKKLLDLGMAIDIAMAEIFPTTFY